MGIPGGGWKRKMEEGDGLKANSKVKKKTYRNFLLPFSTPKMNFTQFVFLFCLRLKEKEEKN